MRLSTFPHARPRDSLSRIRFSVLSFALAALVLASVLLPNRAQAQIFDWTNTSSTFSWFDQNVNWAGGTAPGAADTARFNSAGAYEVWWGTTTESLLPAVGMVEVLNGNVTFLNQAGTVQDTLTINGSGGAGNFSDFSISGASTSLTNRGIHLHSLGGAQIVNGATMTLDGSHAYGAKLTVDGSVGFQVDGNLNVQAGGVISNTIGSIGNQLTSTGVATVTGANSQWNNTGNLYVGQFGNGTLNVEAGGVVSNLSGVIGRQSGSMGDATVTGTGSQWTNSAGLYLGGSLVGDWGEGTLDVNSGGRVQVGNDASFSTGTDLLISDSGANGFLIVRNGSTINNTSGMIGGAAGYSGTATVTGTNSKWTNTGTLYVGNFGNGTLNVEAGGVVSNVTGHIGRQPGSTSEATVTGTGSQWTNSAGLYLGGSLVGDWGVGTLNVTSGGRVQVGNDTFDSGAVSEMIIGSDVAGDGILVVRNGSTINNTSGMIGGAAGYSGTATVTGTGSQWTNTGNLYVGFNGNGTLNVEAGGVVSNTSGVIGFSWSGVGVATVTGTGSQWTNSAGLYLGGSTVGDWGVGTLNVTSGGRVQVGNDTFDSGAVSEMIIGSDAAVAGILVVRHGSEVTNDGAAIIEARSGYTGWATVTGTNSKWNNTAFLWVGDSGNGTLNVEAGGLVENNFGRIGNESTGVGVATVTGTGSKWENTSNLVVGKLGMGTLNVQAGGLVSNTIGKIGELEGSTGMATVTGTDSQWTNSNLYIGGNFTAAGGTGTLDIADNGLVSNSGTTKLWSGGTINLDGGGLTTGSFDNSQLGTLNFNDGTLTVNGAGGTFDPGTADFTIDGSTSTAQPTLVITNTSSATLTGDLIVGSFNQGTLNVEAGGVVNNNWGYIGRWDTGTGVATVTGSGSKWINTGNLWVGTVGTGTLSVEAGGLVSNVQGVIGHQSTDMSVATVTGTNSKWNNSGGLFVGNFGNGTLNVEAGGLVSNSFGGLGVSSTGTGVATVNGPDSQWNNTGNLWVGDSGNGTLNVEAGGVVNNVTGYVGNMEGSTGMATVTGTDSQWNNSGNLWVGNSGNGTLNVEAGGLVSNEHGFIGRQSTGTGVATVTGSGSHWNNSGGLYVGNFGNGTLNVEAGGLVSNSFGSLGVSSTGTGVATVNGPDSQWNNTGNLWVGDSGNGTLNVEAGGVVNNVTGYVGNMEGSTGMATVTGTDSQWNNTGFLVFGRDGNGTLNVEAGGVVSNVEAGYIGEFGGSTGMATVTGSGSQWNNFGNLGIAPAGTGTLNIADSGLVTVGGTTTIGTNGTVNLTGGRFEFGQSTLGEIGTINATSGSMAGNVTHSGYTDVATLIAFQNNNVDLTDVTLTNSGILYGDASLGNALINNASGEVETVAGERMRFAGPSNTNAGEINNFGGQIRFAQDMTNQSGGFVSGRGQFIADGGWNNDGVMAFSGGFADVLGDVTNSAGGQIVTSGFGVTTLFDDLEHNGAEIRTADSSGLVILGAFTGAGSFTGTGSVFFEGDLRPGNSPDVIDFEGNVLLGTNARTFIELGGINFGDFDRFDVAGNMNVDGELNVELWNGFTLGQGMEFIFSNIGGNQSGMFDNLGQNDLVGNFGGIDLFINYHAGDGNDIALFSSVPEPGTAISFSLLLGVLIGPRRRRRA